MSEISERADELIDDFGHLALMCGDEGKSAQDEETVQARQELAKYISTLEAEVEALRPFRDGYDIKDKQPPTGQPIRALTADGRTWFDYVYHPAFDNQIIDNRRIVRWWPLPEVKEQG